MIEFNLSPLEPTERFQFWHDIGSLVCRPVDLGGDIATGLHVHSRMTQLGEVVMGKMVASRQRYERTESMIKRDYVDHFILVLMERGSLAWESCGSQFVAEAGDIALLDMSTSSRSEWSEHQQVFVNIPRDLLAPLGSSWQPSIGILHASHPYTTVLAHHLKTIWDCQVPGSEQTAKGLGLGLATLVKEYFKDCLPSADGYGLAQSEQVLAASILSWIESELSQPALGASMISRFFYVSRSTVYELFRPWGGVRAYIQKRRLEKAMDALQSPLGRDIRISTLASDLGFTSISVFSRAFRERWGVSPREARNRACAIHAVNASSQKLVGLGSSSASQKQLKLICDDYYATFKQGRDQSISSLISNPAQ